MTRHKNAAGKQLAEELSMAVRPLAEIAGPRAESGWPAALDTQADSLVDRLGSGDDRIAADAMRDVMGALWPHGSPETVGRTDWWRTALGHRVAATLAAADDESVTHATAAEMLGVHKGTVAQLVSRGNLERHGDGGVRRASVLRRLSRMAEKSYEDA